MNDEKSIVNNTNKNPSSFENGYLHKCYLNFYEFEKEC